MSCPTWSKAAHGISLPIVSPRSGESGCFVISSSCGPKSRRPIGTARAISRERVYRLIRRAGECQYTRPTRNRRAARANSQGGMSLIFAVSWIALQRPHGTEVLRQAVRLDGPVPHRHSSPIIIVPALFRTIQMTDPPALP
jgi:hypothetical protein